MTQEQNNIWEYLTQNALGKDNSIRVSDLAEAIGILPKGTNNDDLRNLIKEMVTDHGKQIGSWQKGVFIILNDQEREIAAKFVERENRADAVRNNGNYIP